MNGEADNYRVTLDSIVDTTPAIFLAPHYDDVVLSCGGTVARSAGHGQRPLVVTIFGGEITDEVTTDFARWKHSRWGVLSVDEILEKRRAEERAAATVLGYRSRALGFPDAIYRGDRYLSDPALYGSPVATENRLAQLIADEVKSLPEWNHHPVIFVPLGIGSHVDHQLTYTVGRLFACDGVRVFAYEDCPYVIHTPAGLTARLSALADELGEPQRCNIASTLDRRVEAIGAYASQIPVLFRFTNRFDLSVRGYAEQVGDGQEPAERFWPVLGHPGEGAAQSSP
jgi:LmbE family N-acetylglucosaminyl deacetylase